MATQLFQFPLNYGTGRSPANIQNREPNKFIDTNTVQCIVNAEGISSGTTARNWTHIYLIAEGVTGYSITGVTPSINYTLDTTPSKIIDGKNYDLYDARTSAPDPIDNTKLIYSPRSSSVLNFTFTGSGIKIYNLMILNQEIDLPEQFVKIDPDFEDLDEVVESVSNHLRLLTPYGERIQRLIWDLTFRDTEYNDTGDVYRRRLKSFFMQNRYFVFAEEYERYPDEIVTAISRNRNRRYPNDWKDSALDLSWRVLER